MSLYNRLFEENEDATALLGMLELTRNDFQRYRDIWLNKEGTIITVFTRLGGGNRKEYKQVFKNIKKNKNYIKDFDDDFDETYAYFQFRVPEKYKKVCKQIAPKEDAPSFQEKFTKTLEEMSKPGTDAYKKSEEIANIISDAINNGKNFIGL